MAQAQAKMAVMEERELQGHQMVMQGIIMAGEVLAVHEQLQHLAKAAMVHKG
jgi:hypothetical protein